LLRCVIRVRSWKIAGGHWISDV